MRLFVDLDSNRLIASAGDRSAASLAFKRGDSTVLDVYFVRAGVVQELGTGATGKFGLKVVGDYGGDFVVSDLTWAKSGTGASTYYRFEPDFNTDELNALLIDGTIAQSVADEAARFALTGLALGTIVAQADNTTFWEVVNAAQLANAAGWGPAPQKDDVTLMGEIEWIDGGAISSTNTVSAVVTANDVIKGSEGVPTSGTPAYPLAGQVPLWRVDLTGLTGGEASKLDSLVTATGLFDDRLVLLAVSGALRLYQLVAGTDAEASPQTIRPDDYASSTNEKVWKQVL